LIKQVRGIIILAISKYWVVICKYKDIFNTRYHLQLQKSIHFVAIILIQITYLKSVMVTLSAHKLNGSRFVSRLMRIKKWFLTSFDGLYNF